MCDQIKDGEFEIIPFPQDRKAIDVGYFICDYNAFKSQFGWEPKIKFKEGIVNTLEFYEKNLSYYA